MENYDIKRQIKAENKNKLLSDGGLIGFFSVILLLILFQGGVDNPFAVIHQPDSDQQLEKEYKSGTEYVRMENAELEYTGYYKEDKDNQVIYNCYLMELGKKKYFVFVPAGRSGDNKEAPGAVLKNYTFSAKIQKDKELFETVAEDYNMTVAEFCKSSKVSELVFNEARSNRKLMFGIWGLAFFLLSAGIGYIIYFSFRMERIEKNRYVKALSIYGDPMEILNNVNNEINEELLFDSNNIKVTRNWVAGFKAGRVFIVPMEEIGTVEKGEKVKRAYGFVKLGYELYVKIITRHGESMEFFIENEKEEEELLSVLKADAEEEEK